MAFKHLTKEEKAEVVSLAQAGLKQRDLALKFGVSQPSISALLKRQGVKVVKGLTNEQVQDIRYLLKTTGTIAEVAKAFSCSFSVAHGIKKGRFYKDVPLSVKEQELENKMQLLIERRKEICSKVLDNPPQSMA